MSSRVVAAAAGSVEDSEAEGSVHSVSSLSQRFVPKEDDDETLWEVIEILEEKKGKYRVQWAGEDPNTMKPWPPQWVPKQDVTDDLVVDWKRKKREKERKRKSTSKRGRESTTSRKSTTSTIRRSLTASTVRPPASGGTSRSTVSPAKHIQRGSASHSKLKHEIIEEDDELDNNYDFPIQEENYDEFAPAPKPLPSPKAPVNPPNLNPNSNPKKRKLADAESTHTSANSAPVPTGASSKAAATAAGSVTHRGGEVVHLRQKKKRKIEMEVPHPRFDPEDLESEEEMRTPARGVSVSDKTKGKEKERMNVDVPHPLSLRKSLTRYDARVQSQSLSQSFEVKPIKHRVVVEDSEDDLGHDQRVNNVTPPSPPPLPTSRPAQVENAYEQEIYEHDQEEEDARMVEDQLSEGIHSPAPSIAVLPTTHEEEEVVIATHGTKAKANVDVDVDGEDEREEDISEDELPPPPPRPKHKQPIGRKSASNHSQQQPQQQRGRAQTQAQAAKSRNKDKDKDKGKSREINQSTATSTAAAKAKAKRKQRAVLFEPDDEGVESDGAVEVDELRSQKAAESAGDDEDYREDEEGADEDAAGQSSESESEGKVEIVAVNGKSEKNLKNGQNKKQNRKDQQNQQNPQHPITTFTTTFRAHISPYPKPKPKPKPSSGSVSDSDSESPSPPPPPPRRASGLNTSGLNTSGSGSGSISAKVGPPGKGKRQSVAAASNANANVNINAGTPVLVPRAGSKSGSGSGSGLAFVSAGPSKAAQAQSKESGPPEHPEEEHSVFYNHTRSSPATEQTYEHPHSYAHLPLSLSNPDSHSISISNPNSKHDALETGHDRGDDRDYTPLDAGDMVARYGREGVPLWPGHLPASVVKQSIAERERQGEEEKEEDTARRFLSPGAVQRLVEWDQEVMWAEEGPGPGVGEELVQEGGRKERTFVPSEQLALFAAGAGRNVGGAEAEGGNAVAGPSSSSAQARTEKETGKETKQEGQKKEAVAPKPKSTVSAGTVTSLKSASKSTSKPASKSTSKSTSTKPTSTSTATSAAKVSRASASAAPPPALLPVAASGSTAATTTEASAKALPLPASRPPQLPHSSYSTDVVPETEPESNSQSQSQSQSLSLSSQPEPNAAAAAQPPLQPQPQPQPAVIITKSSDRPASPQHTLQPPTTPPRQKANGLTRQGSLKSRMKPRTPGGGGAYANDIHRKLGPIPMLSPTVFIPHLSSSFGESVIEEADDEYEGVGGKRRGEEEEESIEQFESPVRRKSRDREKEKEKSGGRNGEAEARKKKRRPVYAETTSDEEHDPVHAHDTGGFVWSLIMKKMNEKTAAAASLAAPAPAPASAKGKGKQKQKVQKKASTESSDDEGRSDKIQESEVEFTWRKKLREIDEQAVRVSPVPPPVPPPVEDQEENQDVQIHRRSRSRGAISANGGHQPAVDQLPAPAPAPAQPPLPVEATAEEFQDQDQDEDQEMQDVSTAVVPPASGPRAMEMDTDSSQEVVKARLDVVNQNHDSGAVVEGAHMQRQNSDPTLMLQQMEEAFVDLNGGSGHVSPGGLVNHNSNTSAQSIVATDSAVVPGPSNAPNKPEAARVEDDLTDDESREIGHLNAALDTNLGRDPLLLREEEEESTQDVLMDLRAAAQRLQQQQGRLDEKEVEAGWDFGGGAAAAAESSAQAQAQATPAEKPTEQKPDQDHDRASDIESDKASERSSTSRKGKGKAKAIVEAALLPTIAEDEAMAMNVEHDGYLDVPQITVQEASRAPSARPYSISPIQEESGQGIRSRLRSRSRSATPAPAVTPKKAGKRAGSKAPSRAGSVAPVPIPAVPVPAALPAPEAEAVTGLEVAPGAVPDLDANAKQASVPLVDQEALAMQSEITLQAELISRLKARLASESAKNEGLQLEVLALQPQLVQPNQLDTSSEQERAENATALEKLQKYVLELEGQRTALTAQKEEWEITHKKLLSDLETETHRKIDAEKDRDFFKEQYAKASGFVGQVRDENKDLEKKATIAQEQATTGVAGVRMLFEARVKMLDEDLKAWRRTAEFMIQKDIRTNDDIRKRAAEAPELHARCARQEVALEEMQERQDELEEEVKEKKEAFEVAEREVEHWKSQAARLNIELSEAKTKLETIARAAGSGSVNESFSQSQDMGDGDSGGGSEMVYCCQWRTSDGNGNTTACKEAFSTISELEQHLFTGGHLQPS